jgi:hypothetical protein
LVIDNVVKKECGMEEYTLTITAEEARVIVERSVHHKEKWIKLATQKYIKMIGEVVHAKAKIGGTMAEIIASRYPRNDEYKGMCIKDVLFNVLSYFESQGYTTSYTDENFLRETGKYTWYTVIISWGTKENVPGVSEHGSWNGR